MFISNPRKLKNKVKINFSLQNLNVLPSVLDGSSWVSLYVGQNLPAGQYSYAFITLGQRQEGTHQYSQGREKKLSLVR